MSIIPSGRRPVAWIALLMTACPAPDVADVTLDPPPAEPCISVGPDELRFERYDIVANETPDVQTVTVSNPCEGELVLGEMGHQSNEQGFKVGQLGAKTLAAGASTTFDIAFQPSVPGKRTYRLQVASNAPEGDAVVLMSGTGVGPKIRVTPDSYDYGAPFIGCESAQPFTITNIGNADLVIDDVRMDTSSPEEFSLDIDTFSNGSLPFFVAPYSESKDGPAVDVFLDYLPLKDSESTALAVVRSNDPAWAEVLLPAKGRGTVYGDGVDTFVQPSTKQTDVVVVVDRTLSMIDKHDRLMGLLEALQTELKALDLDYRLAAVVADDACVLGSDRFVDDTFTASEAAATLETMVDRAKKLASSTTNTEKGLTLAHKALSSPNASSGGCNEGILRPGARLSTIHVTDGPDRSDRSWSYYVDQLTVRWPDADLVMHAIAGDYPSGCSTASAGRGYYAASVSTGGAFLSVCSADWTPFAATLAADMDPDLSAHELGAQPIPMTLEVAVDGIVVTDWVYDVSHNAIVFDEDALPRGGATVTVTYDKLPDCEG